MENYLFIDGSYYCFYRFHALLTWWKNAHRDEPLMKIHLIIDYLLINSSLFSIQK